MRIDLGNVALRAYFHLDSLTAFRPFATRSNPSSPSKAPGPEASVSGAKNMGRSSKKLPCSYPVEGGQR